MNGVFNFVSPQIVTHSEFVKKMGKNYGSLFTVNIPAAVMKLLMGEGASLLISGQKVEPRRLQDAGFRFETPTLDIFFEETSSKHGFNGLDISSQD